MKTPPKCTYENDKYFVIKKVNLLTIFELYQSLLRSSFIQETFIPCTHLSEKTSIVHVFEPKFMNCTLKL